MQDACEQGHCECMGTMMVQTLDVGRVSWLMHVHIGLHMA